MITVDLASYAYVFLAGIWLGGCIVFELEDRRSRRKWRQD